MELEQRDKLFTENVRVIYSFCHRNKKWLYLFDNDLDDYISSCVVYVLENIPKYDENKGSIATFIHSILNNYMYYLAREYKRKHIDISDIEQEFASDGLNIETTKIEEMKLLHDNMTQLLFDVYFEDYTLQELCDKHNVTTRQGLYFLIKKDITKLKVILKGKGF